MHNTDPPLSLMSLETWCRIYLDRQSPADLAERIRAESVR